MNASALLPSPGLPAAMTPAIAEVLGLPTFQTSRLAHLFRTVGADIKPRFEDEQAFVLWRLLQLAIVHGDDWRRVARADVDRQLALVRERASPPDRRA